MGERKACPAMPCPLCLRTEKEFSGLRLPDGIDNFRDPRVASFSILEGLGNDRPMGVLASERRHHLGREPWLSRSHREEWDDLFHSHPGGSSG